MRPRKTLKLKLRPKPEWSKMLASMPAKRKLLKWKQLMKTWKI